MKIQVFGRLTEIVDIRNLNLDGVVDTDSLVSFLAEKYPVLQHTKFMIAVDRKQVLENTRIDKNSMIVLMPPFSGG